MKNPKEEYIKRQLILTRKKKPDLILTPRKAEPPRKINKKRLA